MCFEFSKHAFPASIPLRGPLHEMNLSLRKKYEEGRIPSEPIFQQPVRLWAW